MNRATRLQSLRATSRPARKIDFRDAKEHLEKGICQCGIYLAKNPKDPGFILYVAGVSFGYHNPRLNTVSGLGILAVCIPYGIVVEAERGYRSERVWVDRLIAYRLIVSVKESVFEDAVSLLEMRYQMPILRSSEILLSEDLGKEAKDEYLRKLLLKVD